MICSETVAVFVGVLVYLLKTYFDRRYYLD